MSARTSEANRAILSAWEREQKLVREGKGTRDWTKKQQEEILELGKAYDDDGKAFHGQHMKCVTKYPEHQGNPDNIQFLTKTEHLEAHKGDWRNPTNWYYNPETKEYIDFGEGDIIPCKIIKLTKPIVTTSNNKNDFEQDNEKAIKDKLEKKSTCSGTVKKNINTSGSKSDDVNSKKLNIKNVLKNIESYVWNNPNSIIDGVETLREIYSSIKGNMSSSKSSNSKSYTKTASTTKINIASKVSDIVEHVNKKSPNEHIVSAHKQRYHTKNGIIEKNKASYSRGMKK